MIAWWWALVAFVAGGFLEYKVGVGLVRWAFNRQQGEFQAVLGRMDYDRLLRMRDRVQAEIVKRKAP